MSDQDDKSPELPLEPSDEQDEAIIELEEPEEEPSDAVFEQRKGYVASESSDRISQQGFYGTRLEDGRLEIEPVEVLHLLERKRIILAKSDGTIVDSAFVIKEMIEEAPDLWVRYLVFRDLRSRGYAVRQGFGGGIGFRVYSRGERPGSATANQLIYVLKEGVPISLHDLDTVTETASAARKTLLFALVDQNGEVNYYRVARATLRDLGGNSNNE
ncbi:MAG: tRNA-intron lyase [Candidatus Thorarchaeota archaeon]|nr:tRNA-intron lyase [Candidatus Thorarchaeota archaeon]